MSTAYQVEPWQTFSAEALPLFERHWREVALDHERVPLDVDFERYQTLQDVGALRVVTARRDGKLIGYHVGVYSPHLHYRSTAHLISDVYWVAPECRHGVTALRLFQAVEADAKALTPTGVCKLYTGVKLHIDQGSLFEHLGYRPTERLYTKVIQGAGHAE